MEAHRFLRFLINGWLSQKSSVVGKYSCGEKPASLKKNLQIRENISPREYFPARIFPRENISLYSKKNKKIPTGGVMGCATAIQSQKETKVISRVLDPWLSLRKHRMEGDAKHPGGTKQTFPLLSCLK